MLIDSSEHEEAMRVGHHGLMTTIDEARAQFKPAGVYCNTASLGLPSRTTADAMRDALSQWQAGRVDAPDYDEHVDRSRRLFAVLAHTTPDRVAIGSQISVFSDIVASSLQPGDEVLVAVEDFTSVLFPFLAQQPRGVTVRCVPLDALIDSIDDRTKLVAVSSVQSADGRVLDTASLADAAERVGARTYLDTTQSTGWLPVDTDRFSFTSCHAYKWLCSPRGTAFFTVQPSLLKSLPVRNAGWYAGADVWTSIYGAPLRLADDARRFDLSPAWLSWVGTAAALQLLVDVGTEAIGAHDIAVANDLRAHLGMDVSNSAVVLVKLPGITPEQITATLDAADVQCAVRAGGVRLAFHLYNDKDDVAAVASALLSLTGRTGTCR